MTAPNAVVTLARGTLPAFEIGNARPLVVSPQHRRLLRGPAAQALFNTPEVLVAASDLVNDRTITVDSTLREVTYVHVLLARHQIVLANGLETESFHPSNAARDQIVEGHHRRALRNGDHIG